MYLYLYPDNQTQLMHIKVSGVTENYNCSSEISNQAGVHSSVFHTAPQNVGNDAFCELCEYAIGQSRPNLYPGERVSSKCMTRKTNMEAPRRKVQ
jgi:hypothetical protein